ncbi:M24 family metallopeptidase C-terminal domain-containing protein, partial [Vibrio sp. 2033]|uniref:M24 family metallopeptidase C-terminal domain-containing protein n=1 Tax=Vibrio sp. 2033 TaxID=3074589 RepID=UPI002963D8D1
EFGIFYGFETITLAPIATNTLDVSLLSHDEINWLNQYHSRVYQALSPSLDEHDKAWLQRATQFVELWSNCPISRFHFHFKLPV